MARSTRKNVYERIEDKKNEILEAEQLLTTLNEELETLYSEKDDLEMKQLLEVMKSKGLTINEAIEKMRGDSEPINEIVPKARKKKVEEE